MIRTLRPLALAGVLTLAVAACGEDADDDVVATDEAPEEEPDDGVEDDAPDGEGAEVAVGETDLGEVLVDGEGMTLYMFDPDQQGESACYDDCAAAWPPLSTEGDPVAGEGADAALLGTVERDDGGLQVTYDDWPLYHWQGDGAPGDATGQSVEDVWWVLEADGTPIRDEPDAAGGADDEDDDEGMPGY